MCRLFVANKKSLKIFLMSMYFLKEFLQKGFKTFYNTCMLPFSSYNLKKNYDQSFALSHSQWLAFVTS
jgi:hypothetical protein